MSAFVIDTATMDRVVRGICAKGRYQQIIRQFGGISTTSPDAETEIGRRLFTLNIEAVTQRYWDGRNAPAGLPGPEDCHTYPHTYVARKVARQLLTASPRILLCNCLKAMGCLRYQCSEGDVPETSALYRELSDAIGAVAYEIVSALPEYEMAPW